MAVWLKFVPSVSVVALMKKLSVLAITYDDRVGSLVVVVSSPPLRYAGRGGEVGRSTTNMPCSYLLCRYLHKQSTKRNNMDPIHYEKIADKLMQFRGKIPKDETLGDPEAKMICDAVKNRIDLLLMRIDEMSRLDNSGWIR